ncbi:multidrug DMT transporter permease [Variovorax sp. PDNC026]|uniref:multidrug DMT transporter permease n=1 Tax=Variovorax sp. PDNC026 TaxID=2811425 RepID=UPI001F06937F|nr:multidrug DMT transporter permease [Variovorax sp. PDNC026]
MDELRILIARLGWPATSARWWTMQALAARLGDPAVCTATEHALLAYLRGRRLEIEVIEALCIFWMAARRHGYAPVAELSRSISKPSVLSNLFLADLGLPACAIDSDLCEVPQAFEIAGDFQGVQGVELPRIFQTTLSRLERQTDRPYVRQMAFEWERNRSVYQDTPMQGDVGHFIRPLGEGFHAHLSARAAQRAISAYLRTLAVAQHVWDQPQDLVREAALWALPIHPTLAFLKPERPTWMPLRNELIGEAASVEAELRRLVERVELTRPGDELIALRSPIEMTMGRCVELSLVRWLQAPGSRIAEGNLATYLEAFWDHGLTLRSLDTDPLCMSTPIESAPLTRLLDGKSRALPLAGTMDLARMGYLQYDLYPSHLLLPTLAGAARFDVAPFAAGLEIRSAETGLANYAYWNAGWGPVYPKQLSGNCGAALVSRGTGYRALRSGEGEAIRSFYLWRVRTLHRSDTYSAFSETTKSGTFFV